MAIEFNGKGKVNNFGRIELPKDLQKEENVAEQPQIVDNKFVKDLGEDLLTSTAANVYGINFTKASGIKIDKDFWGDALDGLKLKDTVLSDNTTKEIAELDNAFLMFDMERQIAKSPFMQALNDEFGII